MAVNFGNVAKNYAKFRNDLPIELIDSLKRRGIHFKEQKVVDLGSGTGVLSRALQQEGAVVVGVEPSKELIEEAIKIDKAEGVTITYENAFSERTPLLDHTYDFVTVMRAWHWFDADKTLAEVNRILKENGKLIVMDSGFIGRRKVVVDTLEIIKEHMPDGKLKAAGSKSNATGKINSFPIEWFKEWQAHRFDLQDTYKFTYNVTFSNEEWCGRVGSLSWLSSLNEEERSNILEKLYHHLEEGFKGVEHHIQHGCYVAILNRL